jgi:hypothetical protein
MKKKALTLLCVAGMLSALTLFIGTGLGDSDKKIIEETPSEFASHEIDGVQYNVSVYPEYFDSIDELKTFIENDEMSKKDVNRNAKSDSISKNLSSFCFVPQKSLPGFKSGQIMYIEGADIATTYTAKDYVYDENFDGHDNYVKSTAIYSISLLEGDGRETLKQFTQGDFFKPLLDDGDKTLYYRAGYCSDDKVLINHGFVFIEYGKFISVSLPAIDGLDEYDMVKYLEMAKV